MKPTTPDFTAFFRANSGLYLILEPDLTIVDASDEYLRATMTWRDEIKGTYMFDAFPDNPNAPSGGARNLDDSLHLVLKEGKADTMGIQRYDVRDQVASGGGKWVEKYWAPMNYPVFGRGSREITHVVHQVFDFTRTLQLRQRVEEQIIANEEQQSTVEEMLRQLKSDRRDLDIARKRLSEIVHAPDEPQPLVNELSKRLGSLDANSYLSAGYSAPRSGVYDVFHKKACRFALSPIFLRAGDKLRPCYYCRHEIRYRFSKPFEICP